MSIIEQLICLLEKDTAEGIAALAEKSQYSKDFLYGVMRELEADGAFVASDFVVVTLENDW